HRCGSLYHIVGAIHVWVDGIPLLKSKLNAVCKRSQKWKPVYRRSLSLWERGPRKRRLRAKDRPSSGPSGPLLPKGEGLAESNRRILDSSTSRGGQYCSIQLFSNTIRNGEPYYTNCRCCCCGFPIAVVPRGFRGPMACVLGGISWLDCRCVRLQHPDLHSH